MLRGDEEALDRRRGPTGGTGVRAPRRLHQNLHPAAKTPSTSQSFTKPPPTATISRPLARLRKSTRVLHPESLKPPTGLRRGRRQHRHARAIQAADHVIQMPCSRISSGLRVIGAQAHIGAVRFRSAGGPARPCPLETEPSRISTRHYPFLPLFPRLGLRCRLMLGADARGDIAVQIPARIVGARMPVDMAAPKTGSSLASKPRITHQAHRDSFIFILGPTRMPDG